MARDLTVWLRPGGGQWVAVGTGLYAGVRPERFKAKANAWGSDTCSFDLRRDPTVPHPDLSVFTPCEVEVAGVRVWRGRVKETPSQEGADVVLNVQGDGLQYHLDDDKVSVGFVHTALGEWRDARSFLNAPLGLFKASGQVSSDKGTVKLGWVSGDYVAAGAAVGVVLDLGPSRSAEAFAIDWVMSNSAGAALDLYLEGWDDDARNGMVQLNAGGIGTGALTTSWVLPAGKRYLSVFLYRNNPGFAVPDNQEALLTIKAARVFADDAWRAATASTLTASQVVTAAKRAGSLQLAADESGIEASTFVAPSFWPDGFKTPRELMEAANALEDRELKIDLDDRLLYRARTETAELEVGSWAGSEFKDAALNSGDEIFNRVVVTGTGPADEEIVSDLRAGELRNVPLRPIAGALLNPSFSSDLTGWTIAAPFGSTGQRDTSIYDSSPASLKLTGQATATQTVTADLVAGLTYVATFRWRANNAFPFGAAYVRFGDNYKVVANSASFIGGVVAFTPKTSGSYNLVLGVNATTAWFDDIAINLATPTAVDRAGLVRTQELPVQTRLTQTVADRIAELFLRRRMKTPLKGDVTVQAGGVRRVIGGDPVHPAWLLRDTGQLLRLADRVDPDTGGFGRDGRIAAVDYDHDTETAQVSLDNDRRSFDALLSRLEAVIGS